MTSVAALGQLRAALAVTRTTGGSCMCHGDLTFAFSGPGERRIAVVGFHHPGSLRWSGWDGDALLRDGPRVRHWLAERGIEGPAPSTPSAARQRWLAAAPPAVRDLLDLAAAGDGVLPQGVSRLVTRRLTEAVPDPVDRTVALLIWYGSGSGRWSDHPGYEALPETALAGTPVAHLVAALRASPADARVDAGAVRHLCGPESREHRARDIAALPADLRARLLAAARESGDDDKRQRAEHRLGDGPLGDGPLGDGPLGDGPLGDGPLGDGRPGGGRPAR